MGCPYKAERPLNNDAKQAIALQKETEIQRKKSS